LLAGLERVTDALTVEPVPSQQLATHVFRLLRPQDLVVLDVLGVGLELRAEAAGPVLVPVADDAYLRVRFAFQHLGEIAFYRMEPDPSPNNETPANPPVRALAAQSSRLVFDVPAGERIPYTQAGVLAALSRLPLRVAPLATPATSTPSASLLNETLVNLVTLPNGFRLGRLDDGRLAMTRAATSTARTRAATTGSAPLSARDVIARQVAVRSARVALAGELAVDLTAQLSPSGVGGLVFTPVPIPRPRQRPRAPKADETAIEAPFRLIISPSKEGGFTHAVTPVHPASDGARVELWQTRLGVRQGGTNGTPVTISEARHPQRAIRAIWARDKTGLGVDQDAPVGESPFRMALTPRDRLALVRQSADPQIATPKAVDVDRLALSALGAYLELHGQWPNVKAYLQDYPGTIDSWDHEAMMGRDQYVRVAYPGYLFPFGHKALLIKVTERKILDPTQPKAYLYQRKFIVVKQPVRTFDDRRLPFRQVSIRPLVTPDLVNPEAGNPGVINGEYIFWPHVSSGKFRFTLDCLDHNGARQRFQAPLLFVNGGYPTGTWTAQKIADAYTNDPEHVIAANGQQIAYAAGTVPGDTTLESVALRFAGTPGPKGSLTSTPFLSTADVVIPTMRHLAPSSPQTTVRYTPAYLTNAFAGNNAAAQLFLELTTPVQMSFGQSTEHSGGFIQPDLPIHGLSRVLGTVGKFDDLLNAQADKKFNPAQYLQGVFPKLFGLFELTDILGLVGLDRAPKFITEQLDKVGALLADLAALQQVVASSSQRLADDAANAATAALRQQAQDARNALEAVRGPLNTQVTQLTTAIGNLLDPSATSSLEDVTAAVEGILNALRGLLASLRTAVRTLPLPPPVKAQLERLLDALEPALVAGDVLTKTLEAITQFVNGLDPAGGGVRARLDWRPKLKNFPDGPANNALFVVREDGLLLSVEARASGSAGVGVDALAELRDFSLNLFPGAPLMRLGFDRLAFRAASGRKPEVDVVFRGIEFLGVLSFIETLKSLIPFDGYSDPPYVDVSTDGVTAGFSLALPSTAVGVFSLENISLGADARVPFLGNEALTIGFNFCTREKPFRLTVMAIGGGGFVGIRLSPRGLVVLEMSLEAGASLSINLGVASGSVSVMVGVYLRLEGEEGSLTGYFRIRGEVDVLGLISASITLELSLKYEFASGKLVGRASLEIEVDVFLVSFTVTVTCERRLAGSNGDPTLQQLLGPMADGEAPAWSQYCAAFAEA
jgi:hypothetical protein